ncbi:hypothetical protein FG93_05118 [Bosea sp. LC85]|uniref:hypothetical protein n=1 Tax=Bosea sp. LC85 TaxID=1502851 RepID=UPI0004E36B7F|nr:hypothetical protein [Bosea sp. LC85]KFC64828.1 hypothetical protein FG93_05118 [Bosea sp. LC85]
MHAIASGPAERPAATTTAGLRGTHWDPARLPAGVEITVHSLRTHDGATVVGFLMRRGGEKTVVCAMHPREMTVPQYLAPEVLRAGAAFWVQGSRSPNSDLRLEHETAILDLAAGQRFLRSQGFKASVLQGTSGGGPLAAFYCQQTARPTAERLTKTPAGRPIDLAGADLPAPDGLILISSHLGQGALLQSCLDPSVTDEADPFATDAGLNPFDPANGFAGPPQSSRYEASFIERYRKAQTARSQALDEHARGLLRRKAEARARVKSGSTDAGDLTRSAWSPLMTIWRTDADPRCWDLSLEASPRAYGSLWGGNPFSSNWGSVGFARSCTPESWLSNWSAACSNATMERCAPGIDLPVCMIRYTGDNSVFDSEADRLASLLAAAALERHDLPGNHHGRAVAPGEPDGQGPAGQVVQDWLSTQRLLGGPAA